MEEFTFTQVTRTPPHRQWDVSNPNIPEILVWITRAFWLITLLGPKR